MSFTKESKFLSLVLRHKPQAIGITLDAHGWADVQALISGMSKFLPFNFNMLEEIVRTDAKQRYAFNEDKTQIRANQGHSIAVDVDLDVMEPPEFLWHGTGEKYVASISEQGLISQERLYVHLSEDPETACMVGIRHGNLALYRVCSGQMAQMGYTFYRSANGVWLTQNVPVQFLEKQ